MKKYIIFSIAIIGLAAIAGCNKKTVITELPVLRASSILQADSVHSYMEKYKTDYKEMAGSYFKKGKAIEKTNATKATYYIKRAITLCPTAEYYVELARLLSENKQYEEAAGIYRFLVNEKYVNDFQSRIYIFEKPTEDLYYEDIVNELLNNNMSYAYPIDQAKEDGFDMSKIKTRLLADSRLKLDPSSVVCKSIMMQFLSYDEIKAYTTKPEFFQDFVASINKETETSFEIDQSQAQQFNYHDHEYYGEEEGVGVNGSYFYDQYLQEKKEKPDGYFNYNFERQLNINDDIVAIIYAIDSSETACPKEMRHIYRKVITYNKNGEFIDARQITTQSGELLSTVKFTGNKFAVSDYKRSWKNPYNKNDFDNYLLKTDFVSANNYEITQEGKIVKAGSI